MNDILQCITEHFGNSNNTICLQFTALMPLQPGTLSWSTVCEVLLSGCSKLAAAVYNTVWVDRGPRGEQIPGVEALQSH